jgi:hypothetical protein
MISCEWSAELAVAKSELNRFCHTLDTFRGRFTPGEGTLSTHCVGPRTGLDGVERGKILTIPGLELDLGRPARNQLLY